jgi:serine/threonine-protein kinase
VKLADARGEEARRAGHLDDGRQVGLDHEAERHGAAARAEARERRGFPVDEVLAIALGLCDGLGYAHAEDVVHGCPRPELVYLGADGNPVLHGFEPLAAFADPVLRVGMVVDNAHFLAPEAVRREGRDARTDLWSLGALLYHMLTATYPQTARG